MECGGWTRELKGPSSLLGAWVPEQRVASWIDRWTGVDSQRGTFFGPAAPGASGGKTNDSV